MSPIEAVTVKVFLEMLAPPVQTSKTTFWPLHHWCKQKKQLFGSCTIGANGKNYFLALAPPVQIAKTTFWPLHHRCKHFQKRSGHRMVSVATLCWLYSYIELILIKRCTCYRGDADISFSNRCTKTLLFLCVYEQRSERPTFTLEVLRRPLMRQSWLTVIPYLRAMDFSVSPFRTR